MHFNISTTNNHKEQELFNTYELQSFDSSLLRKDCFCIIMLTKGVITARIQNTEYIFNSPSIICLDERKSFVQTSTKNAEMKVILFNPVFLNVNMQISCIRNKNYTNLCEQHLFFQLSPFITNNLNKISFHLSEDTMSKINYSFININQSITNKSDWYWSCRARSYLIDIINTLEHIVHNYSIEQTEDSYVDAAIMSEFKNIIVYINNHLDEKLTLEIVYKQFRINKNQIEELFKKHYKTTFYKYLKSRRFEEAAYYLRFTSLSGEEIANRIGLSSSQNFCKFFNSITGLSPNKYRKEMLNKRKTDVQLSNNKLNHYNNLLSQY